MKKLIICCLLLITTICRGQNEPIRHRIILDVLPADSTTIDTTDGGVRIDSSINGQNLDIVVGRYLGIDSIQKRTGALPFNTLNRPDSTSDTRIYHTRIELTNGQMILKLLHLGLSTSIYVGRIPQANQVPAAKFVTNSSNECMCDEISNYDMGLIHYDFKCKVFYNVVKTSDGTSQKEVINVGNKTFRNHDQFRLRIDRVNRYLYDVDIIGKNVTYESTIPPLLSTFFIGDSTLLMTLSKKVSAQSNGQSQKLDEEIKAFYDKLQSAKNQIANLEDMQMDAYDICYEGDCCLKRRKIPAYNSIISDINAVKGKLPILKKQIADDEIKQQIEHKLIDDIIATYAKNHAEVEEIDKKLQLIPKDAEALLARKTVLEKENQNIKIDSIKDRQEQIQNKLDIYEAIKNFSPNFPSEKEVKQLVMFVKDIVKDNFTFVTPPIQVTGNKFELGIQIRPKDTSLFPDNTPYYSDYSYYEFPVIYKAFISFSSGSFVTFSQDFYNRTYDWQKIPNNLNMVADSGKYRLVETGYTPLPIGFSALANVEWKLKESFGLGFSAGVGLTMEKNPRLAYLGGISFFFGDLHQFALTGGIAGMNVDHLTYNLQAVHDQQITYTFKDKIDYYKEFRIGGFMAITYTPFNAVKRPVYRSINKSVRNAKSLAYDAENNSAVAKAKAEAAKTKEENAKKANEDASKNVEAAKKSFAEATTKVTDVKKAYETASKKTLDLKKDSDDAATKAESSKKPEDIKKAEDAKKAYDDAQKAENDAKKALDDATTSGNDAKKATDDAVAKAEDAKKAYDDAHKSAEELNKAAAEAAKIAEQTRQAADNAEKMAGAAGK